MTLEEALYWHESLYGTSDPEAYQIWDQAYQVIRQHEHPEEFEDDEIIQEFQEWPTTDHDSIKD